MSETILIYLAKANIAASAVILLVFAMRRSVRRAFGPRAAYRLWLAPLLAAVAMLLPAPSREVVIEAPPIAIEESQQSVVVDAAPFTPTAGARQPFDPWSIALWVWIAGALLSFAYVAAGQARYQKMVRQGLAGPAVIGFLRPRIVAPADLAERFAPGECEMILAHERMHVARGDARVVALAVIVRAVNWFNPLIYLAVNGLRIDQELACDAQVVDAEPAKARFYAQTMIKAQLSAQPVPVGCAWPAGAHPLTERVALVLQRRPSRVRMLTGAILIAAVGFAGGVAAWASQPREIVTITRETAPQPAAATAVPVAIAAAAPAEAIAPAPVEAGALSPPPAAERKAEAAIALDQPEVASEPAPELATCAPTPCLVEHIGAARIPSDQPWARYYDGEKPHRIRGRLSEVRFNEPGVASELVVETSEGDSWRVIGGDAVKLSAEQRDEALAAIGQDVVVLGYQSHDPGDWIMNGQRVTMSDGRPFVPPRQDVDPVP